MADQQVKLKDKHSGAIVWLTVRGGKVVGAMGSDPQRYLGLPIDAARYLARYGAPPRALKESHAVKYKLPRYTAHGWAGGEKRRLYTYIDNKTGAIAVRPGELPPKWGPDATVRPATKAEGERYWQSPLSPGWTTVK